MKNRSALQSIKAVMPAAVTAGGVFVLKKIALAYLATDDGKALLAEAEREKKDHDHKQD